MNLPSKLIEDAVCEFERLPGIGRKTALRLVLHLLKQDVQQTEHFSDALRRMRREVTYCRVCHNISDGELCSICSSPKRNQKIICVVEGIRDVIAIESTQQFSGTYHVLGGVISPLEGITPAQLYVESLVQRVAHEGVDEIIMALNPTIDGDTTIFYISKRLHNYPLKITTLSRGVAFGAELEYTDDMTLARSITSRMPYENYLVQR